MIELFKIAWRDLGRNRRRSFFSALALGLGVALLLLISSAVNGEMYGSLENSIRLVSGHLQVRSKTYNAAKNSLAFADLVENPEQVAAQIAALPDVQVATPRLYGSGILTTADTSTGVAIVGIDPASPANAPYRDGMLAGSFLAADDREGFIIGKALAAKLGAGVGDQINLLVNTSNGDAGSQTFTVRGIFSTGTPTYDNVTIFLPLAKLQALTQTESHASAIWILLKDRDRTDAVAAALKSDRYQIVNWVDQNTFLFEFQQMAGSYMGLIYLIVLAITATVIINTLIMAVFERTREIGILAAIGMKGGRIMAMFFAESVYLAVGGILIGLALGGVLVALFQTYGFPIGNLGTNLLLGERIYARLAVGDAVNLTVMALIVTLLAALYPASLAARMEPVDALRGGK